MKRHHIAQHEATHAVVAMRMGLPVAWVTIDEGFEEGIQFAAAVKIPDEEIDFERDKLAICVSMAAPSHIISHRDTAYDLYRYAQIEANMAYEIGGRAGITFEEIFDLSATAVGDHWDEICELALRLESEGRVVFDTAAAC